MDILNILLLSPPFMYDSDFAGGPGLEFTLPDSRLHYKLPSGVTHYTMPDNRLHYSLSDNE